MPLVIYTGIHAIARESELRLPVGTQRLTLDTLTAESPSAVPSLQSSGGVEITEESQQVLLVESFPESVFQRVSQWLKQTATNKAMMVWPRPVAYIAALLAAGRHLDEALEEWQQLATSVLKLFYYHRRQLTLVSAEPGSDAPHTGEKTLLTLPAPEHSPIFTLAAKQLVEENEYLTQTFAKLTASSALKYKSNTSTSEQVKNALAEQHQLVKAQQETEQKIASLQEENDMVIAELHRVQELLESKLIERDQRSEQRKKEVQQHNTWEQWLKANANRFTKAAYRHSRTHRKTLSQQIALLNTSTHFDSSWYLEQYPDLKKVNINPAEHYLKFGALEGRNPSPHFNTEFYVTQYPDVASSGQNPLLHYLRYGQMEQRKTNYEQLQLPSPQSSGQEVTDPSSQATQDEETR